MTDHDQAATRPSQDFELVLVLSGGNALGAFQAGVYEALHERGLRPHWIVGTSIGAINGALIAGNALERRIETLRGFWQPGWFGDSAPRKTDLPFPLSLAETWRRSTAAAWSVAAGRPGLFGPVLSALAPWTSSEPSLFETDQMARTLDHLIDFERLNGGTCRYTATAVDLESGEDIVFDNVDHGLDARHVRASAALPVLFPPVEIDGRWHVDGGLSANLPLDPVLAEPPTRPTLCIAVDLVPLRQPLPRTLGEVASRSQDLIFAAQSRRTIARWKDAHDRRQDLRVTLIRLAYTGQEQEIAGKALDFSGPTAAQRWADGKKAAEAAFDQLPVVAPLAAPGLSVLDL